MRIQEFEISRSRGGGRGETPGGRDAESSAIKDTISERFNARGRGLQEQDEEEEDTVAAGRGGEADFFDTVTMFPHANSPVAKGEGVSSNVTEVDGGGGSSVRGEGGGGRDMPISYCHIGPTRYLRAFVVCCDCL